MKQVFAKMKREIAGDMVALGLGLMLAYVANVTGIL